MASLREEKSMVTCHGPRMTGDLKLAPKYEMVKIFSREMRDSLEGSRQADPGDVLNGNTFVSLSTDCTHSRTYRGPVSGFFPL